MNPFQSMFLNALKDATVGTPDGHVTLKRLLRTEAGRRLAFRFIRGHQARGGNVSNWVRLAYAHIRVAFGGNGR